MNPFSPDTIRQPVATDATVATDQAIDLGEFTKYLNEVMNQPAWRARADREMDYVDGNQLGADVLQRQKSLACRPPSSRLSGLPSRPLPGSKPRRVPIGALHQTPMAQMMLPTR